MAVFAPRQTDKGSFRAKKFENRQTKKRTENISFHPH